MTVRPRCKGTCGDIECLEAEQQWLAENGISYPEQIELPFRVPIVMIESPYAGDVEQNMQYLRDALKDCLLRGEAPFASHGLYTMVLDDTKPEERKHGIEAGFAFRAVSDYTAVYTDLGISPGMVLGIEDAHLKGKPIKYRTLPNWRKKGK